MAKVLLGYVNSFMDNLVPIGTSLLSSCLRRAGHETALFDTTFYRTREKTGTEARVEALQVYPTDLAAYGITENPNDIAADFRSVIQDFKPDLIGLSVVESTWNIAQKMLAGIRDIHVPKIVGGIHATMASDEVIKNPDLDMLCRGEGEGAFVELADRVSKGEDYSDVRNLWIKKDGGIVRNPIRPLVSLDDIPDQDWSIYEKKRFFKPMGKRIWVSGPVELDRGCTYHCAFCCNDQLQGNYKGIGKYPRQRSVKNFMAELRDKKERYGLEYLYLVAENFLHMSKERFDEFASEYKNVRLPFWIETRPETVTSEKIGLLGEIGCEGVSIGVEHGNDEFRRNVLNRRVPDEVMIRAFERARAAGARVCANNIIGFPGETRELLFDTINLNRVLQADNVITNIFVPYRGTPLRNRCVEMGLIPSDFVAGDYRADAPMDTPHLTKEQVLGLQRTFPMYVKFPKDMWPQIREAERFDSEGNSAFQMLSKIYKEKYM